MNGICGWIGFPELDGDHAEAILAEMLDRVISTSNGSPSSVAITAGSGWALGIRAPEAAVAGVNGVRLAFAGEPVFREPDLARRAKASGFPAAAGEAFVRSGSDFLRHLGGSYALAILAPRTRELLLAVDRMAVQSLAYAPLDAGLVFASSCDAINRHPRVSPRIDPQALFDYTSFHVVPAPRTAFGGQRRLDAGSFVHVKDGHVTEGRHWRPEFEEGRSRSMRELEVEFKELLRDVVGDRIRGDSTGSFLSGGTDSSTIAGVIGQLGSPARTFSIGFDVPEYDELEYAHIASRHFRTNHSEYVVTPADVIAALPIVAAAYDAPFGNASAVPTFYCARLARDNGITQLLAGDGGDELFGGNARYATQHVFNLYRRVPGFLRRGVIEPVLSIPGVDAVPLVRKARNYARQASLSMPTRLETYNLVDRIGVGTIFTPEFLSTVDREEPADARRSRYVEAGQYSLINQMLAYDFKFTLADSDLPKVTRMCAAAGTDVAFPFLDDRMVDFASRLPPDYKLRGTRLRYFFKRALADFLPAEIIAKRKHGFGLPVGVWFATHKPLGDLGRTYLDSLAARGIVRKEFVSELWARHLPEHPGYYGTLVWILLMLEMWHQHHWDPISNARA